MTNAEQLQINKNGERFNITQLLPRYVITVETDRNGSRVLSYPPASYAVLSAVTNARGLILDNYNDQTPMTLNSGGIESQVLGASADIVLQMD